MEAITKFKVQVLTSEGPIPELGWTFYPVDINTGDGGKYLYIGYQRVAGGQKVGKLSFLSFDKKQTSKPAGWDEWSDTDLNSGAGGKFIYMVWNLGGTNNLPIVDVQFVVTRNKTATRMEYWESINQDLNQGAAGRFYIWPYYTTQGSFKAQQKALEEEQEG